MRGLVQRVSWARVEVDDERVGEIGHGICLLVGVTHEDEPAHAEKLVTKVSRLRIFDDDDGVMNRSLVEVGGEVLVVSQFTLYANTTKGRRPSYIGAARPEQAEPLIEHVVEGLRGLGITVATGRFRADMAVSLCNDGPITLMLDV